MRQILDSWRCIVRIRTLAQLFGNAGMSVIPITSEWKATVFTSLTKDTDEIKRRDRILGFLLVSCIYVRWAAQLLK
jgi:hypothetical protein